jgi:hypothetical protein
MVSTQHSLQEMWPLPAAALLTQQQQAAARVTQAAAGAGRRQQLPHRMRLRLTAPCVGVFISGLQQPSRLRGRHPRRLRLFPLLVQCLVVVVVVALLA